MSLYDDDSRNDDYSEDYPIARRRSAKLPTFCLVMFIIDLIFCCLRVLFVILGVVGYQMLKQQGDPMADTALYEIVTGGLIVLFGIPANGLMLAKQKWAVFLGWLTLVVTFASIAVGIWQASVMMDGIAANGNEAEQVGGYIGAGFSIIVRLGIVICYAIALLKFSSWSGEQEYS